MLGGKYLAASLILHLLDVLKEYLHLYIVGVVLTDLVELLV